VEAWLRLYTTQAGGNAFVKYYWEKQEERHSYRVVAGHGRKGNPYYKTEYSTERWFTGYATAVIVEPFHRCISPVPGFLQGLRELTRRHGIALVFDEVVTGFRFALGGAQEYYGVIPDLVAYGKALGGGFPIGAYGGRADLTEAVNEHRLPGPNYAWSASTTGGNPVSCAAALAALEVFSEPGFHARLHARLSHARSMLGACDVRCWRTGMRPTSRQT
jgi:glutamate-1-semialdehyde aminotransferase